MTRTTFNDILKLESIDECKWRQATLKIKHGDFGLISTESSNIAFVASWAHSIHELPLRFPSLQESVDTVHSTDLELLSQSLAYHLNSAFLSLPLSPSLNDNLGNAPNLCDLSLNPVKLQQ